MNTNDSMYSKYNKLGDNDFSWQKDCSNSIRDKQNVILSAPTGSGKTKVFLEWALSKSKKPVIITAPIKALSNQRYRELLAEGYTVGLETGDIKNVPDNCDFICCTQEIYTNKYAELKDITVIMDEFHFIFENPDRARTYIDALYNSKAENILLCSATLGDLNKFKEYVNRVSGREFFSYESDARLTSLFFEGDIKIEEIINSLVVTFSRKNIENILSMLYSSRTEQDERKIEEISKLAEDTKIDNYEIIKYAQKGISGYHGTLLPKEKLFIEKCFERGVIDTVVGTDALALGVNFPVKNVIFAQLAKYYDGPISKNLFDQLAGRAGRKGFFDEGHVYYSSEFAEFCESWEYDIQYLFERILEKSNENISIILTPNIKDILLGKRTIEEEAEFISRFSTRRIEGDLIFEDISNTIDYINNHAFGDEVDILVDEKYYDILGYDDVNEYYSKYTEENGRKEDFRDEEKDEEIIRAELMSKKDEFLQNIAKVYFDEYSPEKNCEIFTKILCGIDSNDIVEEYGMSGNFNDMLQFRKYVKNLPKRYRKGLTKINSKIREIDEFAIDGFRGSISVGEIGEQLEQEGKLSRKNVMNVLKEQENMQRMKERIGIIDEQLRIAEEYGLEDY